MPAAANLFERAVELLEQGDHEHSRLLRYRYELANSYANLAALHRQTGHAGAAHISGLRARRDHVIVWVGYNDDAKIRALYHVIDERDWIDGMFVSGDVLIPTRFGESAAHGEEGRCKHDASKVAAPRQELRAR